MRRPGYLAAPLVAVALFQTACGSEAIADRQREKLNLIREATAKYEDMEEAIADGYRPLPRCIESDDGSSALGFEYLHLRRSRDQEVELLRPEQLFYEEQENGRHEFVGVGYFVPDDGQKPPESPLGHFDGPIPGQYRGQSAHYELHVWLPRPNPDGMLAFFNPDVRCIDRSD